MSSGAPSTPASQGSTTCWNCGQEIPAGTPRCLYCGVPQDAPSARLVVAPHGVVGAPPPLVAPPTTTTAAATTAAAISSTAAGQVSALGAAFAGTPARTGMRVFAFTIDVLTVSIIAVAVGLLTGSGVLAVLAAAELLIGLWVLQARTGLGLGNLLLRHRVSRIEEPFSPGVDRAFVRAAVTLAGALVLLVGAWVVEASAAWDRSGLRRSWADRAAGTVVVALPPRVPGVHRRARPGSHRRAAGGADVDSRAFVHGGPGFDGSAGLGGAPSVAPPQVSMPTPVMTPDVAAEVGGAFGRAAESSSSRAATSAIGPGGREPVARVEGAEAAADGAATPARTVDVPPREAAGIPPLTVPGVPPLSPGWSSAPGSPAPSAEPAPGPRRTSRAASRRESSAPASTPDSSTPAAAPPPAPLTPPPLTPPPLTLGEPQRRSPAPRVDRAGTSVTGAPGPRRSAAVPIDDVIDAPGPRRRSRAVPGAEALEPSALEGLLLLVFDTGQREQLPIPVTANLGRNPAASEPSDLLIAVRDPDSTVSKTHLRLEHSRSGTWVTDTGSTNGTDLLDEEGHITPLSEGVRTLVEDGVRVRVGNRVFTVNRLIGAS